MTSEIEFLLLFGAVFALWGFVFGIGVRSTLQSQEVARAYRHGRQQGVAEAAIYMQPAVKQPELQRVK